MWVFFYISGPRVRQLAAQINPRFVVEATEKRLWEAGAEGELATRPGLLLRSLGVELDGKAAASGGTSGSTETRVEIPADYTVSLVCERLSQSREVSFLSADSTPPASGRVSRLVRFRGGFRPRIPGKDPVGRLSAFRRRKWLNWIGACGETTIELTTRRESFVGETPIIQCLRTDDAQLQLDGFGTCGGYITAHSLAVVPIILGIDFQA